MSGANRPTRISMRAVGISVARMSAQGRLWIAILGDRGMLSSQPARGCLVALRRRSFCACPVRRAGYTAVVGGAINDSRLNARTDAFHRLAEDCRQSIRWCSLGTKERPQMEIIYCSRCGIQIPPGGMDEGRRFLQGDSIVCPKCYRKLSAEDHSGQTIMVTDVGERSLKGISIPHLAGEQEQSHDDEVPDVPPVRRKSSVRNLQKERISIRISAPRSGSRHWLLYLGVAVPAVLLTVIISLSIRRSSGPGTPPDSGACPEHDSSQAQAPGVPVVHPPKSEVGNSAREILPVGGTCLNKNAIWSERDRLQVKTDESEIFLEFDLSSLKNRPKRATLRLTVASRSNAVMDFQLHAGTITPGAWNPNKTAWASRPLTSKDLGSWRPWEAKPEVDVTDAVSAALGGDCKVVIRVYGTGAADKPILVHYHSGASQNTDARPKIMIEADQ